MSQPNLVTYEVEHGHTSYDAGIHSVTVKAPAGLTARGARTLLGLSEILANIYVRVIDGVESHDEFPSEAEMQAWEQELINDGIIEPGE